MKKLCTRLALILAAVSTAAVLTGSVLTGANPAALAETAATPTFESGDYTYILMEDGSAQIVDWEGGEAELVVPAALDGHAVTSISENAFADCAGLASVSLPEGLKEIGENAFCGCTALGEVRLPESLERIGDAAFRRCEALTDIALPEAISEVGDNPFRGCANLVDIFVSPDHDCLATVNGVLFTKPDRRLVCYPMRLPAERYAVPEGVVRIGAHAFERNLYLEAVALPETVTGIGEAAFGGCEALEALNLPGAVAEIGEGALEGCDRLTLSVEERSYAEAYAKQNGIATAARD